MARTYACVFTHVTREQGAQENMKGAQLNIKRREDGETITGNDQRDDDTRRDEHWQQCAP